MSTEFKYDLMVYIGRFQPFHNGHVLTIEHAAKLARRVVVLVGSHKTSRSIRNPFTSKERMDMIRRSFPADHVGEDQIRDKLILAELEDYTYNDQKWIKRIQEIVQGFKAIYGGGNDCKIGITGFDKDSSSYYLKAFPQWDLVPPDNHEPLDATDMRHFYFDTGTVLSGKMPQGTLEFLATFKDTEEYHTLHEEYRILKEYKKSWENAPYPPTFSTVDSVVVQAGHILLVQRDHVPGRGLYALPGGFVNPDETLLVSALRELKEETKIDCPVPVIKGSQVGPSRTFDDPKRSTRGRTITEGFLFHLEARPEGLYKVKGADDARKAEWWTIEELDRRRDELFEDHYHIIRHFLGRI